MTFLVDAQLPRRLAIRRREAGHDAKHTLDLPQGNRATGQTIVERSYAMAERDIGMEVLEGIREIKAYEQEGGDLQDEIAAFCRRWQIAEFALFGSVLRPDFCDESDVDVLVTFDAGVLPNFRQLLQMEEELETLFGRSVDLLDKQAVQESPNYIRRKAILGSAQVVHAR